MNQFKSICSRYSFVLPRSIAYMMQSCEYEILQYLRWCAHNQDWQNIEIRKHIDWTHKAVALWLSVIGGVALLTILIIYYVIYLRILGVGIVLVLLIPAILPYLAIIPLAMINLIQRPYENHLIQKAKIALAAHKGMRIAVAGSFGKTSMREILKSIIGQGKKVACPTGSHNVALGIAAFISTLKGDEDVLIFELGEYRAGDIARLCNIVRPDIGVITGVNEAHTETLGSVDVAAKTIFALSDFVSADKLWINGESMVAAANATATNHVYSSSGCDQWTTVNANTGLSGTEIVYLHDDKNITVTSKLIGLHHVGAISAAASIATYIGLNNEQISAGIGQTLPFEHRMQVSTDASGVIIIDDSYNGNPDGVVAAISFLKSINARRWYVTPGLVEMGSNAKSAHVNIGIQLAQAGIENVVLIKNSVTSYIAQGLNDAGYKGKVIWYDNALRCLASLPHITLSGDVVLLQNDWPDQYK